MEIAIFIIILVVIFLFAFAGKSKNGSSYSRPNPVRLDVQVEQKDSATQEKPHQYDAESSQAKTTQTYLDINSDRPDVHIEPDAVATSKKSHPIDIESSETNFTQTYLSGRVYVVDGDTIRIQKTQIRLFGIDAPEMCHPYGKTAKWALFNLCKGQIVRAEITAQDDHGRAVAKCYLPDGRDISAEMVKLGLAIDWKKFSGGCYLEMELPDARKKLWRGDARQKGRMHVWKKYDSKKSS